MKHETGKYEGKFVSLDSSGKVIASGKNSGTVIDKARRQGMKVPIVIFVSRRDVVYLY